MKEKIMISIIIVNWNGKKFLKDCFDSLVNQSYKNFEVIFVDNASKDDSTDFIKNNYQKKLNLKIIINKSNFGFAKANNIGAKIAKGKFLLLLNNDTKVPEKNLEILMREYPKLDKPGAVGCILKNFDGSIQDRGCKIDLIGYPIGISVKNKNKNEIFYPSGSFFFIDKELYKIAGGLEEKYFMYMEEVDLSWRLLLLGYKNYTLSNCFIYHYGGGTSNFEVSNNSIKTNKMKLYEKEKNMLNMLIKNYSIINLILYLPLYLLINFLEINYWILKIKPKNSLIYLKSWLWNLKEMNKTLDKRSKIQCKRVILDSDIKRLQEKKIIKLKLFLNYGFNVKVND